MQSSPSATWGNVRVWLCFALNSTQMSKASLWVWGWVLRGIIEQLPGCIFKELIILLVSSLTHDEDPSKTVNQNSKGKQAFCDKPPGVYVVKIDRKKNTQRWWERFLKRLQRNETWADLGVRLRGVAVCGVCEGLEEVWLSRGWECPTGGGQQRGQECPCPCRGCDSSIDQGATVSPAPSGTDGLRNPGLLG